MCMFPVRQYEQNPHGIWDSPATLSPVFRYLTLLPTSRILPDHSCPIVIGSGDFHRVVCSSQRYMWRSEPHIAVASILTRTSEDLILGSSISWTSIPGFGTVFLIAFNALTPQLLEPVCLRSFIDHYLSLRYAGREVMSGCRG